MRILKKRGCKKEMSRISREDNLRSVPNYNDHSPEALDIRAKNRKKVIADAAYTHPIIVCIPTTKQDCLSPAFKNTLEELRKINAIVVIGEDQADQETIDYLNSLAADYPNEIYVSHNDGDSVKELHQYLKDEGKKHGTELVSDHRGKGYNMDKITSVALSICEERFSNDQDPIIVFCDSDVVTFDVGIVEKLAVPLIVKHQVHDYQIVKSFFTRIKDNMLTGRATRLFIKPFIEALERTYGEDQLFNDFRKLEYPLSGEVAVRARTLWNIPWSTHWGAECGFIGHISEHNIPTTQAKITNNYIHKNQSLAGGLEKMVREMTITLFDELEKRDFQLDMDKLDEIISHYKKRVNSKIYNTAYDAAVSGLDYDEQQERLAVELFTKNMVVAAVNNLYHNGRVTLEQAETLIIGKTSCRIVPEAEVKEIYAEINRVSDEISKRKESGEDYSDLSEELKTWVDKSRPLVAQEWIQTKLPKPLSSFAEKVKVCGKGLIQKVLASTLYKNGQIPKFISANDIGDNGGEQTSSLSDEQRRAAGINNTVVAGSADVNLAGTEAVSAPVRAPHVM